MREIVLSKIKNCLIWMFPVLILILFFNKILFTDNFFAPGDYLRSDTINQNLPFKYLLYNSLKENKIPLWNNSIFAGFPLAAEGQTAVFYPLNILFFKTLSFIKAYNYLLFVNFLIVFLGTYLFGRQLKLNRFSAMFCSLVFSLSSFFILHITHQNILASAVWLPWIFFFNLRYFTQKNINYFIASTVTLALSLLAGSIQIAFYIYFSVIIYVLIFRKELKVSFWKILGVFILEGLIAFLLSAIQILPTIELIGLSNRSGGLGSIALNSLPYHPRNFLTFIFPYIFGDPGLGTYPHFGGSWGMFWENTGYIGLIPLCLALISLAKARKDIRIRKIWILAVITMLLVLGKYSPLFWVFYLPIFNSFRVTSRFLLIFLFYLTILSGLTIQDIAFHFKDKANKIIILSFILLFTVADLFIFGYGYNPTILVNKVTDLPENAKVILSEKEEGRVFSLLSSVKYDEINKTGWRNNFDRIIFHKNALDPDINILWNIENIDGYAGLYLNNSKELVNQIFSGIGLKGEEIMINRTSLELLGLSSVRYIISPYKIADLSLLNKAQKGTDEYYVYLNPYYLPRGILLKNIDGQFDYGKVLKEGSEGILITKDIPDSLSFAINSKENQWFILQDTYYPGWKAFVNGAEVKITPYNNNFRAVEIPEGKVKLEFKYKPLSFETGKNITLVSLIAVGFIYLAVKVLDKRRKLI